MFEEHSLRKVIQEYLFHNLDQFKENLDRSKGSLIRKQSMISG